MKEQRKSRSHSAANLQQSIRPKKKNKETLGFEDNRPEGVRQLKIKQMVSDATDEVVQRKKKYIGKKKRRRKEQDRDLRKMDKLNKDHERKHGKEPPVRQGNRFAALAGLVEDPTMHEEVPKKKASKKKKVKKSKKEKEIDETPVITHEEVTIQQLLAVRTDRVEKLKILQKAGYSGEEAKEMSRAVRLGGNFASFEELAKKAGVQSESRERRAMASSSRDYLGSGSLNSRGTVSGLKKGIGQGYKAGTGSTWHVHYDHVKYNGDNGTRVNFEGRTQKKILEKLDSMANSYPTKNFAACRDWIVKNIHP